MNDSHSFNVGRLVRFHTATFNIEMDMNGEEAFGLACKVLFFGSKDVSGFIGSINGALTSNKKVYELTFEILALNYSALQLVSFLYINLLQAPNS